MAVSLRKCEVCGSARATGLPKYTASPWPVVSCDDCGFVFLHHVPGYQALAGEYAWEKTRVTEKERRMSQRWAWFDQATRWRLKIGKSQDHARQARALGRIGNLLNIGCGGGGRLLPGLTPYGIEISSVLASQARPVYRALGGDVHCAPAIEGLGKFQNAFFNSILMRSYLEHEQEPRAVLEKALDKLTPGGVVYVRVPNFGSINRQIKGVKWCGFRFPDHVNYFTERSLSTLATSIGYAYRRRNWASIFDDNLTVELTKPER